MTDLHKAAQAALEAMCLPCDRWNATQYKIVDKAISDLRTALAQEPAQPASHAWECRANIFGECSMGCATAQPAVQKPVGYVNPEQLNELKYCNGMNLWTESHQAHYDHPESTAKGLVAIYAAPVQPAVQEPTLQIRSDIQIYGDIILDKEMREWAAARGLYAFYSHGSWHIKRGGTWLTVGAVTPEEALLALWNSGEADDLAYEPVPTVSYLDAASPAAGLGEHPAAEEPAQPGVLGDDQ